MIEREPNFEDEKIRTWMARPEDRGAETIEGDPTVLSLDVEREEIYESRTYRFRRGPKALFYLIDKLVSQYPEGEADLDLNEVIEAAAELMEETTFKILAKRRKEGGSISSVLVAVTPDRRSRLDRHEWREEQEYRQGVDEFEAHLLSKGVLTPPLVVTLDEWRRYLEQSPLSQKRAAE